MIFPDLFFFVAIIYCRFFCPKYLSWSSFVYFAALRRKIVCTLLTFIVSMYLVYFNCLYVCIKITDQDYIGRIPLLLRDRIPCNFSSIRWNYFYRPPTKLWKGNAFTGVCHSVHRGGVVVPPPRTVPPLRAVPLPRPHYPGPYPLQGRTPPGTSKTGGTHPIGMLSCSMCT